MPELDPIGRGLRRFLVIAMTTMACFSLAVPATAHSDLVSSSPGEGESFRQPPRTVRLEFNEDVIGEFTKLQLRPGPQRPPHALTTRAKGNRVSARIPAAALTSGRTGSWKLSYRVVSADGHPISGDIDFTVRELASAPPEPTPTPTTTTTEETPAASADQSTPADDGEQEEDGATLAAIIGGLVLLLMLVAVFRLTRHVRRKSE